MTVNRGPGVAPIAGVGTTTLEHRLQLAGLYAENAPGVPRSGVLTQATDQLVTGGLDMSYDVGPAALVISRTAGEGVYTPTLTGTTNVPTDAAPATNSRWDLIYVKQNDQAKGDADNAAVIGVQKGLAAASPTKPTADLPAGAYVLAEARIFAGTTSTSGGSNTVAQVWRHTAARGSAVGVRSVTERDEITAPALGFEVRRLDLGGATEKWSGSTWSGAVAPAAGAGWTLTGSLHRQGGAAGAQVAAAFKAIYGGGAFTLNSSFVLAFTISNTGYRPVGNDAYGFFMLRASGTRAVKADCAFTINPAGEVYVRTLLGQAATTVAPGDELSFNTVWNA